MRLRLSLRSQIALKVDGMFCELAKRLPEVQFLVAGSYDKGISVPNNVRLLGKITDQTLLARYYSMSDLTLLTSKKMKHFLWLPLKVCAVVLR